MLLTDEPPFLLWEEVECSQSQSGSCAQWQDTAAHHLLNKEENLVTYLLIAWKYTNDKPHLFYEVLWKFFL